MTNVQSARNLLAYHLIRDHAAFYNEVEALLNTALQQRKWSVVILIPADIDPQLFQRVYQDLLGFKVDSPVPHTNGSGAHVARIEIPSAYRGV